MNRYNRMQCQKVQRCCGRRVFPKMIGTHSQDRELTLQGNYTVEAAFIFPIIILLMAGMLQISIRLYQKVDTVASDLTKLEQIDSVRDFRVAEFAEKLINELEKR